MDVIPDGPPSMWKPETNPLLLALLGKAIEECSEFSAIAARCIIQGIDEAHPENGKINREELTKEIADVLAMMQNLIMRLPIYEEIDERIRRKYGYTGKWFDSFGEQ